MKTILTLCCCLLISAATKAQPGSLDYSFGDSGKVISKYFGGCYNMQVQQDDKIVCAGMNHALFQLVRYLPDGTIDSLFGNNGIVNPIVRETFNEAFSVLIQNDGKILLSGDGYKNGIPTIVLMRFMPDGSFDKNFATYGIADSTFGIGESFSHIALQPDGKILVVGEYYPGFIVIRYNTDGTLDESFGDKGKVLTVFGAGTIPTAIAVAPDGKIVTAGNYGGGVGYSKFLLARYTIKGALDESFGDKGVTTTDFGKYGDEIHNLRIQPDGKIVVAGVTGVRDIGDFENIAVARYNIDGFLDAAFGTEGKTTIIFDDVNSKINDLIIQSDGTILLAGSTYQKLYYGDLDFVLSKLNSNGFVDSSFGMKGITITDFGSFDGAEAIALQKNKIILAGINSINGENPQINYALARYNNDGTSKKQIIITKIKRWLQHRNGIEWNNINGISNYAVQRSGDRFNWSTVYRSPFTANSQQLTVTYYNDPAPLNGNSYYRLQTTSVSGAVNYSNVIAVSADENAITISPNPAKNNLQVQALSSKAKLTVVDFTGNIKIQAVANNSSYNLNIASLTTGNYLLKIEMNGEIVTKKFVKE